MTIERPMFPPRDSSRRGFLTLAAGASVASVGTLAVAAMPATGPDSPACAIDPIFDLIAAHRAAHIAHLAALELRARYERRFGGSASWISEERSEEHTSELQS